MLQTTKALVLEFQLRCCWLGFVFISNEQWAVLHSNYLAGREMGWNSCMRPTTHPRPLGIYFLCVATMSVQAIGHWRMQEALDWRCIKHLCVCRVRQCGCFTCICGHLISFATGKFHYTVCSVRSPATQHYLRSRLSSTELGKERISSWSCSIHFVQVTDWPYGNVGKCHNGRHYFVHSKD